jgi:hypothetical protein
MYSRQTTIHRQSRGDANYLVRQHARIATWLAHIPSVSHTNHASTDAALNANGTI